jgi:hypothetical protein
MSDRLPAAPDRLPATNTPLAGDIGRLIHLQEWIVDLGSCGDAEFRFSGHLLPWHPVGGRPDMWLTPSELRTATFRSWCEITDHLELSGGVWLDPPQYHFGSAHPGYPREGLRATGWWRARYGGPR